jgi:Spy/CpxP family protein refolding chaperone
MAITMKWSAALAIAAMTVWGAGCGTQPTQPQPQALALVAPAAEAQTTYELQNEARHAKKWQEFLDQLNLTADQKTKVDALKDKMKKGDWSAKRKEFADLISGDTVDQAKLQTFFQGVVTDFDARIKDKVSALEDFREILTADQRQKAVQLILDKMASKKHHRHHMRHRGHKFMQMLGGLGHHRLWPAAASFLLSGDKAALEKAFTSEKTPDQRVKKLVDAIMDMDKDDRMELVEHMKRHHKDDDGGATAQPPATAPASPAP